MNKNSSISDKKIIRFYHNGDKAGLIELFDINSGVSNQNYKSIGNVPAGVLLSNDLNKYNTVLMDDYLNKYNALDDEYIDLSLVEFKKVFKVDIQLNFPEKFGQMLISTIYSAKKNWKQEYSIGQNRPDLIYIQKVSSKISVPCMIIENKNANFDKPKEFDLKRAEALEQMNRYVSSIFNNEEYRLPDGSFCDILAKIFVYDGNYLFNKPGILGEIEYLMRENNNFFKSYSYSFSLNTYGEIECKEIYEKGLMDIIKVEEYYSSPDEDGVSWAQIRVENLSKINRSTNPRDIDEQDSLLLARNIVDNMKEDICKKGIRYIANKYTSQKQISVCGKISSMRVDRGHWIYGHNLSLSNGQHSCASYQRIYDIINKPVDFSDLSKKSDTNLNLLKDLDDKISDIKTEIECSNYFDGKSLMDIINLKLSVKIVQSNSREDEYALAISSNSTVGKVDTNLTRLAPIFIKINQDLFTRLSNNSVNNNVKIPQIKLPRVNPVSTSYYINYDFVILLHNMASSTKKIQNPISLFRSSGFGKNNLDNFLSFILNKKNKYSVESIRREIESIAKEIEEKQNCDVNFNISDLLKRKSNLVDQYNEFYGKDILETLNNERYEIILNNIINFHYLVIKYNELYLKSEDNFDGKMIVPKLAFGLINSYMIVTPNTSFNDLMLLSLRIADMICNHLYSFSDFSGKNAAFNRGENASILLSVAFSMFNTAGIINLNDNDFISLAKDLYNKEVEKKEVEKKENE